MIFSVGFLLFLPFLNLDQATNKKAAIDSLNKATKQTKPPAKTKIIEKYRAKHNVSLPDFAAISNVKAKKKKFFSFLRPYVEKANQRILAERAWLLEIKNRLSSQQVLDQKTLDKLESFYENYEIDAEDLSPLAGVKALLKRVDVIPEELVLMQAANESAWGTSRFARLGLNFFGQWCYRPGCGIIPNGRVSDGTHEVKAFSSVQHSVNGYFNNINTNQAYVLLREIRAQLRANQLPIKAEVLATGLIRYSQRGEHYVKEITKMIRHNKRYMGE